MQLVKRTGTVCRILLNLIPPAQQEAKPAMDLTLLSMCGSSHLGFLQQSLLSLHRTWKRLPAIQIISDGTLSTAELEKSLNWWKGKKTIIHWKELVKYHEQKGRNSLAKFTISSVLGRKFAAIIMCAEQSPTLWCDTDIIWFKELRSFPNLEVSDQLVVLKIAEDYQKSYDCNIVNFTVNNIDEPPYFNTGLVYLRGNLLQACDLDELLEIAANNSNHFTEQTLFAIATKRLKQGYWSNNEIACFETDKLSLSPTYRLQSWTARHYVGPVRYSFWRDALFLRLSDLQKSK